MTPDERWLAAVWPFVRASLPPVPARVVEIGCGPLGGFVPRLESAGYEATGVDPQAPQGSAYRQVEFERYDLPGQVDAIVACTSLHHVADLGAALDLVAAALVPGGVAVIVEWARERFDEATARWCFARLPEAGDHLGGLHQRQAEWRYVFPELAGTSEADEQAAIDSGLIQANRIQYVGRRRSPIAAPSA